MVGRGVDGVGVAGSKFKCGESATGVGAVLEIEGMNVVGQRGIGAACEAAQRLAQGAAETPVDERPAEFEERGAEHLHIRDLRVADGFALDLITQLSDHKFSNPQATGPGGD